MNVEKDFLIKLTVVIHGLNSLINYYLCHVNCAKIQIIGFYPKISSHYTQNSALLKSKISFVIIYFIYISFL